MALGRFGQWTASFINAIVFIAAKVSPMAERRILLFWPVILL
jgi:hypothetical protein